MNPEFKKNLDEIRDYIGGVAPEARSALMQALVERLLSEYKPGHFVDRSDVFREIRRPAATNPEPETVQT
ncbi:MAG TPA: hypothetical protein VF975_00815 [Thermoanaerobaculia bacterium]